eukprot:GHVQ01021535.1.p1 GENE.GHVQ01021535.1~~GHVQ01021535.1.p1  ORF type:complete len:208 (+),score=36.76 GHVQ01021535.1:528-1151(+)
MKLSRTAMASATSGSAAAGTPAIILVMRLCVCYVLSTVLLLNSVSPVAAETLENLLMRMPELSETYKFMQTSSILEDFGTEDYGGTGLTVLLPTNNAWMAVSEERKAFLLDPNNSEDLESLLLFTATDSALTRSDIPDTTYIVTLLGVETEVGNSGRVCVLSIYDGEAYECGMIEVWDIPVDEGYVHLVDYALFPEELLDVFEEQGI